ncbi:MAG: hypothetical protein E3J56_00205 [Candidatus Aminicenantes bacterium]|nr:MAG: hypothetical protein E3J56_00205 [Candidatus Aminicenantes bacterium]
MRKIKSFLLEHFEVALVILIVMGILAIAFLVHYKFSFLNFFFLPVILSGYYLGKRKAVLTGIFCVLLVVLYLSYFHLLSSLGTGFSFDEVINLLAWGSFLILTGAIIGMVSEQRESKLKNLRSAYVGVLEILLKYLEVADEIKPRSLRVSLLAGKIAKAAGLDTRDVENIKSAGLLYEAGDLRSILPFFEEVADFMETGIKLPERQLSDREKVMLKTTAALLKEIEPILFYYSRYYVREADILDKNLDEIPIGSSIIALADMYDKIANKVPVFYGKEEYISILDIEKLAGRIFPGSAIEALMQVIPAL